TAERSTAPQHSASKLPNTRSRNRWNHACNKSSIHSCPRKRPALLKPWSTSRSSSAGTIAATASEKYLWRTIKASSPCAASCAALGASYEARDRKRKAGEIFTQRHGENQESEKKRCVDFSVTRRFCGAEFPLP